MRCWPLLLLAACVQLDPPLEHPRAPPPGIDDTSCHLGPAYDGQLKWPGLTSFTDLTCTAKNDLGDTREVCFQPFVGVRQTGALYTTHDVVCSNMLVEGESQALSVRLDMRRELCALEHGGCVIRAITLRGEQAPDASTVIAFARSLEAQAVQPGRDRPTVAECQALVVSWYGRPGLSQVRPEDGIAMCLGLTRSELACLQVAPDARAAEACAPRLP